MASKCFKSYSILPGDDMDHHSFDIKPRHREIHLMVRPAYRRNAISQRRAHIGVRKLYVGKLQTRLNVLACCVMQSD